MAKKAETCARCAWEFSGECRRRAPVIVRGQLEGDYHSDSHEAVWPEVQEDDWCGEFRDCEAEDG